MVEATHTKVYNQPLISITTYNMFWCMSSFLWAPLQLPTLWLSLGKSNVVFAINIAYINELHFIEKALNFARIRRTWKNLSSQPAVIELLWNLCLSFVFKVLYGIMHWLNKEFTAPYCDL